MNKIHKVPVTIQMKALECGAASLAMILEYYEKWVPLSVLREECGVSRDESNVFDIFKAAEHYGLKAKAGMQRNARKSCPINKQERNKPQ